MRNIDLENFLVFVIAIIWCALVIYVCNKLPGPDDEAIEKWNNEKNKGG